MRSAVKNLSSIGQRNLLILRLSCFARSNGQKEIFVMPVHRRPTHVPAWGPPRGRRSGRSWCRFSESFPQ
jgi:hypothetical protein